MTERSRRDELAIANAMLLGDLVVLEAPDLSKRKLYAFRRDVLDVQLYATIEQAAWMFLCRLGYGIAPDDSGLVKLSDLVSRTI